MSTPRRKRNRGHFRKGHDPRRHQLTAEERKRGGETFKKRYMIVGRWPLDWYDQCDAGTARTLDNT